MPDKTDDALPEGDTFDRAYVEGLRAEAAGYRTKLRPFEQAFGDFNPDETEFLFGMLETLNQDPQAGAVKFRDMARNILADQFFDGLDLPAAEPKKEAEASEEAEGDDQVSLTQEQMKAMFDERDATAKAEADAAQKAATEEAEIEAVYVEIENDTGFKRGTKEFATALSVGATMSQSGEAPDFKDLGPKVAAMLGLEAPAAPEAEGDDVADSTEGAVEEIVKGSGAEHAKTAGAGGSGAATEVAKDFVAEAKASGADPWDVARERFEARVSSE